MRGKINNCVWVCEENAVVLVVLFFLVLRCSSVDAWLLALYTRPKCQLKVESFPTTNGGMPNGSSVGIFTHCAHVFFLHVWAPTCVLRRCLSTKFLLRSSDRSLSRVRCWLGSQFWCVWRGGGGVAAGLLSPKFIEGALLVGLD